MNRRQRRSLQSTLCKEHGFTKEEAKQYIADTFAEYRMYVGDKVKLDFKKMLKHPWWNKQTTECKDWMMQHFNTILTIDNVFEGGHVFTFLEDEQPREKKYKVRLELVLPVATATIHLDSGDSYTIDLGNLKGMTSDTIMEKVNEALADKEVSVSGANLKKVEKALEEEKKALEEKKSKALKKKVGNDWRNSSSEKFTNGSMNDSTKGSFVKQTGNYQKNSGNYQKNSGNYQKNSGNYVNNFNKKMNDWQGFGNDWRGENKDSQEKPFNSRKTWNNEDSTTSFGKPSSFGKPTSQSFGKPANQSFGKPINQGFGKPASQSFGKPHNSGFVSANNNTSHNVGESSGFSFGKPANNTFTKSFNNNFGESSSSSFGKPANNSYSFGKPANNRSGFGKPANTTSSFGKPANNNSGFGKPVNNNVNLNNHITPTEQTNVVVTNKPNTSTVPIKPNISAAPVTQTKPVIPARLARFVKVKPEPPVIPTRLANLIKTNSKKAAKVNCMAKDTTVEESTKAITIEKTAKNVNDIDNLTLKEPIKSTKIIEAETENTESTVNSNCDLNNCETAHFVSGSTKQIHKPFTKVKDLSPEKRTKYNQRQKAKRAAMKRNRQEKRERGEAQRIICTEAAKQKALEQKALESNQEKNEKKEKKEKFDYSFLGQF